MSGVPIKLGIPENPSSYEATVSWGSNTEPTPDGACCVHPKCQDKVVFERKLGHI